MKLSIIVPVYNVRPWLERCLDSLGRQGLTDYEVVLVDDASTDGSAALCRQRAAADHRLRLICQPRNGGLSAARNAGIDAARGEWLAFVDSDDYLADGTLAAVLAQAEAAGPDVDAAEFPVSVGHGAPGARRYVPGHGEPTDHAGWLAARGYYYAYAWNKLYRRALWADVRFPEGRLYEDLFAVPRVLARARRLLRTDRGLYYYCARPGSIASQVTPRGVAHLLEARLQLYADLQATPGVAPHVPDDVYLLLCDMQIVQLQLGGPHVVPPRRLPLGHALGGRFAPNYRVKALLLCLAGRHYCALVARLRRLFRL